MIDNCYTFNELKEKFGWSTTLNEIKKQIIFARRRGIIIEPAFKKGPTYFRIVDSDYILNEVWQEHPNSELGIEVSNFGRVRDKEFKYFMGYENAKGYIEIKRNKKCYLVHRLVLETFYPIENSENYFVDHIDGKRTNNILSNLRWVSAEFNTLYRNDKWNELSPIILDIINKYGYDEALKKFNSLL